MPIGDRIAIAALAAAVLAVGLGGWLLFSALGAEPAGTGVLDPFAGASSSQVAVVIDVVIVDVEGAVIRPGVVELPVGSRVADAIHAVGGYSDQADLPAAATQVNLAAELRDGQQIVVPAVGMPADGGSGSSGGLVNLNSASPEELDALPGIGPVTVQKIVAARTERPFSSLDELVTRKVLTKAQLDKIRDLVTPG